MKNRRRKRKKDKRGRKSERKEKTTTVPSVLSFSFSFLPFLSPFSFSFLHRFVEGLNIGVSRNDPNSWNTPSWPDTYKKGIIASDGVGQSQFLWFCRGITNVQTIFKTLWK